MRDDDDDIPVLRDDQPDQIDASDSEIAEALAAYAEKRVAADRLDEVDFTQKRPRPPK